MQKHFSLLILKKITLPIVILLIGFTFYQSLADMKEGKKRRKKNTPPITVSILKVENKNHKTTITGMGKIKSSNPIQIALEVGGRYLQNKYILEQGHDFKKGNLLVQIDDKDAKLTYKTKVSELLTALNNLNADLQTRAPKSYSKFKSFQDKIGFDTLHPLPKEITVLEKTQLIQFGIYRHYFQVEQAWRHIQKHKYYAPYDGVVKKHFLLPHDFIKTGQSIATIISKNKFEARIPLQIANTAFINTGQSVKIKLIDTEKKLEGVVSRIAPSISDQDQAAHVIIDINPKKELSILDGLFCEVKIQASELKEVFKCPRNAFHLGFVYLVENETIIKKKVDVVKKSSDYIYLKGLSHDEQVITTTIRKSQIGSKVNVVE